MSDITSGMPFSGRVRKRPAVGSIPVKLSQSRASRNNLAVLLIFLAVFADFLKIG